MRFITVPEPIVVLDPVTGEPVGERVAFAKFVWMLCTVAASRGSADVLMLIDIRRSVALVDVAAVWECMDEWQKVLADECKRCQGLPPQVVLSAEAAIRAIVEAPSKPPATYVKKENCATDTKTA